MFCMGHDCFYRQTGKALKPAYTLNFVAGVITVLTIWWPFWMSNSKRNEKIFVDNLLIALEKLVSNDIYIYSVKDIC